MAFVPCVKVELHRGVPALPSQIQANHAFTSAHASSVVVAAIAGDPLVVVPETAHCTALLQRGAPPDVEDGATAVEQMSSQ